MDVTKLDVLGLEAERLRLAAEISPLAEQLEAVNEELRSRYLRKAERVLAKRGELAGTVDLGEVKVELPKRVKWDQDVARPAVLRLLQDKRPVIDFLSFEVPEAVVKHWPDWLEEKLGPARTVTAGKAKVIVKPAQAVAA